MCCVKAKVGSRVRVTALGQSKGWGEGHVRERSGVSISDISSAFFERILFEP